MFSFRSFSRVSFLALALGSIFACSGGGGGANPGTHISPAQVTSIFPANGESDVELNALVQVHFSHPMKASTFTPASVAVFRKGTQVPGSVLYDPVGNSATFYPTGGLFDSGTLHVVSLSSDIQDAEGKSLEPYSWSFKTKTVIVPFVIQVIPSVNQNSVSVQSNISVTFSTPMAPATINSSSFLVSESGSALAGSFTYDTATNTATFDPADTLPVFKTISVSLTSAVKDLAGVSIAPFSWNFVTENIVAPTVIAESPAPSASQVAVNTMITATFSEPVISSTLNPTSFVVTKNGSPSTNVLGSLTYIPGNATVTFIPNSPLTPSTNYTVSLSAAILSQSSSLPLVPFSWSFGTEDAPAVVQQAPAANGQGILVNTTISAKFSLPMEAATIDQNSFTVSKDVVPAEPVAGSVSYDALTKTASFSLAAGQTLAPAAQYKVELAGTIQKQGSTLTLNPTSWTFNTEDAPTVTANTPASGVPVSPLSPVTATFSKAMDSNSVKANFVLVKDVIPAEVIGGMVIYNDVTKKATFVPNGNDNKLQPLTPYTATVKKEAQTPSGAQMAQDFSWSFTTGATAVGMPPKVISTEPQNNQAEVGLYPIAIKAIFSDPPDASTINSQTFLVEDELGNSIDGDVSYDVATSTAIFVPKNEFAALVLNTKYKVTLTSDIKDDSGAFSIEGNGPTSPDGPYTWEFESKTTGVGIPDALQVVGNDPTDEAGADPQIIYNAKLGHFESIWRQKNPNPATSYAIYTSAFNLYPSSASAVKLSVDPGNAQNARIAFDPIDGTAYAVWQQQINGQNLYSILFSKRAPGSSTWDAPVELDPTTTTSAQNPQLVVDLQSNVSVVWQQPPVETPGRSSIFITNGISGANWSVPQKIEVQVGTPALFGGGPGDLQTNAGSASNPQISLTSGNNLIVFFTQVNLSVMVNAAWTLDASASLVATASNVGGGLGSNFEHLDQGTSTSTASGVTNYSIARDAAGNILTVFQQKTFSQPVEATGIYSNFRQANGTWVGIKAVSEGSGSTVSNTDPVVVRSAVNASFVAAYRKKPGAANIYNVEVRKIIATGPSGAIEYPDLDGSTAGQDVRKPKLIFDIAQGDTNLVVPQKPAGSTFYKLYLSKKPAGGAWSAPVVISADDGVFEDSDAVQVAVKNATIVGPNLQVVYQQKLQVNGAYRIDTNSFK